MKLEEMKMMAKYRTKAHWRWMRNSTVKADSPDVYHDICNSTGRYSGWETDMEFIAMAANNWDKLMAVVEAARFCFTNSTLEESDCRTSTINELRKTLHDLEKE